MRRLIWLVTTTAVLGLIFWQYRLDRQLYKNKVSCEGDWSYGTQCQIGSYCGTYPDTITVPEVKFCRAYAAPILDVLPRPQDKNSNLTWEECINTPGSIILETYPEQCRTPDGRSATNPDQQ